MWVSKREIREEERQRWKKYSHFRNSQVSITEYDAGVLYTTHTLIHITREKKKIFVIEIWKKIQPPRDKEQYKYLKVLFGYFKEVFRRKRKTRSKTLNIHRWRRTICYELRAQTIENHFKWIEYEIYQYFQQSSFCIISNIGRWLHRHLFLNCRWSSS